MSASTTNPAAAAEHKSEAQRPWVERYRPKSLDDVSHQSEVVSTLQNAVKTGQLPHLLLYGPPGKYLAPRLLLYVWFFFVFLTDTINNILFYFSPKSLGSGKVCRPMKQE